MKRILSIVAAGTMLAAISVFGFGCDSATASEAGPDTPVEPEPGPEANPRVVVAYASSWTEAMPDPALVTHVNYAFGHVGDDFKSVRIDGEERLRKIVAIKKTAPGLRVLLSVGGWGSGNFSEMAADASLRGAFSKNCRATVDRFGLDGIDIDWEYPGSSTAGISSSKDDPANFALLMSDLRAALGDGLLLTLASGCNAEGMNFKDFIDKVDLVNVMAYDMGYPPLLDAALYRSGIGCWCSVDEAVSAHLGKGVPASKLVLGMPFYGRGVEPYESYGGFRRDLVLHEGCALKWDETACEPYIVNAAGELVLTFENEKSIGLKCDYIIEKGLGGGMFWELGDDDAGQTLSHVVAGKLL